MTKALVHFPEVLLILRHGQTEWNREKKLQGRKDIPLNETGRAQALENGKTLRRLLVKEAIDPKEVKIFASPLVRAMETAQIACKEAGLPGVIHSEPLLIEQCYGLLEGMTHEEIQKQYPHCWYMRQHDPLSYLPPEGESGDEFQARISSVIDRTTGVTLLVGHFGLLRTLIALCKTNGIKTDIDFETLTGAQDTVYMVREGALTLYSASDLK